VLSHTGLLDGAGLGDAPTARDGFEGDHLLGVAVDHEVGVVGGEDHP